MADDQGQKSAEGKAQQSAMPTEEQKGQELADSQEEAPIESEESLEAPAGESENGLPKGVTERTREQFEKLKAQLRDARDRLFNSTQVSQKPADEGIKPIYNPLTGLVDPDALNDLQKKAYEAERRAGEAEQKVQSLAQDREVKDLYSSHPELKSPKTKEARELFDEAERIWMHSQAYPEKYGGEQLSQREAADLAKKRMGTKSETPQEEAKRIEAKEQASFGATGQPTQGVKSKVTSEEELQKLQYGTRIGDKDSMITRMRAIREAQESK